MIFFYLNYFEILLATTNCNKFCEGVFDHVLCFHVLYLK